MEVFNVYCDESCHLEHDHQNVMVLGAIWCPLERSHAIIEEIRAIKLNHGMRPECELKWTKVSPSRLRLYLDLVDYFFNEKDLHFRALVALDKDKLRHQDFHQSHDDWYYKMYFDMLKVILNPEAAYRIYLDIKDTRSAVKVANLHDVLCNNMYDFSRQIIERVQTVRSYEVAILQMADVLVGAISYANRSLSGSEAKLAVVEQIKHRSHYLLTKSTLLREEKVNLFLWRPSEETPNV